MRKFQVFRYIKQWKYIIIIITIIGSAMIYGYGYKNQTYIATAVMEYTNADAGSGMNPDGSQIDSSEINSAAVITDVIHDMGLNTNVEQIRSQAKVQEVIPPEEIEKRTNALKLGDEYSYFPTKYQISFTAGSDKSKDYARDVMDSLLNNYFSLYCRKYVDYAIFPNNATNISTNNYDFIDCMDMMESSVDEIIYFLETKETSYPGFRSAETGYSFADLKEAYEVIQNYLIPDTYSFILNNRIVSDKELLLKRYQNNKVQYEYEIANNQIHLAEARVIIDQFGDKTLKENDINYSFGNGGYGSNQGLIIGDVESAFKGADNKSKAETTYDKLIVDSVNLESGRVYLEKRLARCQEVLDVFSDPYIPNETENENSQRADIEISGIVERMNELYGDTIPTIDEFNEKNGSDNLAMRTSVSVKENFNMNIFLILALIFFFTFGCVGAILFGRVADFIEYFMYIDKKTGLPNRNRCDIVIDKYNEKPLSDNFVCIAFKVDLQLFDREKFTRKDGDVLLHEFGGFIKTLNDDDIFSGYNNDGIFLVFIENCTINKANAYITQMQEKINDYNAEAKYPVIASSGVTESTMDNTYQIRDLLQKTIKKMRTNKEITTVSVTTEPATTEPATTEPVTTKE